LTLKERGELVDLFWLASALDHVRSLNQTDVVDYLQSVADDLIFETKMAAHKLRCCRDLRETHRPMHAPRWA
jgi:hypothetical protein